MATPNPLLQKLIVFQEKLLSYSKMMIKLKKKKRFNEEYDIIELENIRIKK